MIDGLNGDTGSDATLDAAAAAIDGLLSQTGEDQQEREAPRRKKAPVVAEPADDEQEETESEGAAAQPEEEVEPNDDEEVTEPAKPEPRKLRVKVDGEELELPEDEVVKGYSRTKDYTVKTQKLAEERRAFQAEADAVKIERQRYAQQLTSLEEVLKQSTPAEPDWDTLREGDPAVYAATYTAWKQHQDSIEKVSAERKRAEEKVMADRAAEFKAALKEEHTKLLEAIPEWTDPKVAQREKADLSEYAMAQGYTPDELAAVTDHRVIKILRDAAAFQKAQKRGPEIEKKIEKARTLVPGSNNSAPKREVSELTRAKQALAKTGSTRDAGNAIAQLLEMEG